MTRAEDCFRKFIFDGITPLLYSPEIKPETKEKIELISEFLDENPEFSFVLYFNHISFNDPALVIHLIDKIDPKHKRQLVTLMSYSHTDPANPKNKALVFLAKGLGWCGIEGIRVIQNYQVDNVDYGYSEDQANLNYMQMMRRLKEMNGTPTGVIISPEGTRSETGTLGKGEKGLVSVGRVLAPVMYIPMAITYEGEFGRNKINIGKKMRINIGEVTVQENPREYPTVEELMEKLAAELPEKMKGVWGKENVV